MTPDSTQAQLRRAADISRALDREGLTLSTLAAITSIPASRLTVIAAGARPSPAEAAALRHVFGGQWIPS